MGWRSLFVAGEQAVALLQPSLRSCRCFFSPGDAFQFDWSCEYAVIGGLRCRLKVAHVKEAKCLALYISHNEYYVKIEDGL